MAGPKGPEEARFLSSEVVVLEIFSLDASRRLFFGFTPLIWTAVVYRPGGRRPTQRNSRSYDRRLLPNGVTKEGNLGSVLQQLYTFVGAERGFWPAFGPTESELPLDRPTIPFLNTASPQRLIHSKRFLRSQGQIPFSFYLWDLG
jgi:hypothetical protein